jgi:hypothetical protein
MHISDVQNPPVKTSSTIKEMELARRKSLSSRARRSRSGSLHLIENQQMENLLGRMRQTHGFRIKGFEGNLKGNQIHAPFTTLDELLQAMPEDVGIDIELSQYIVNRRG